MGSLYVPLMKHDDIQVIKINAPAFKEQMDSCKFSLIAKVFLSKREKPWLLADLTSKLQFIWKVQNMRLISIGCGFFDILFSSNEDKRRVWVHGSISIKLEIFRLQNGIQILILL